MNRERAFFDVFPTYTTEDPEIKEMFGSVKIESIECSKERDRIRVSFVSDHLIHKKVILKAERELQKTIYPKKNGQIRLHERFSLSERYDLENLFREYGNSMLYELKVLSPIMFQLYKESDRKIDQGNRFIIVMADNFIAHDHENMLKDYLYGVICERCGIKNVSINIQYKDKEEREELRRTREDIRAQISEISRRAAESASKKPEVKKTYTRRKGKEYKKTYSHRSSSYVKNSDDPKVFYKGDVPEQATPIKDIIGDMYGITVRGMIRHTEEKLSKNEQWIIMMFDITDFTDTIAVRLVVKSEEAEKLRDHLKEGNFIKLKGNAVQTEYERELTISSIAGMREIENFREYRMDYSSEKRVELHCHTKMSRMDAVSDLMDLTKTALRWGWKSFAITDHGNVQAFQTTVNGKFLKKLGQPLPEDFKFIYGMEGYLVDDLQEIVGRTGGPSDYLSYRLDDTFCAFDIETTGLSPVDDRIIEIGAVLIQNGKIVDRFDEFVDPERPIPYRIEQLTGINDHMVSEADTIDKVLPRFLDFTRGAALIGHNVRFDAGFIEENTKRLDLPFDRMHIDTMGLSRLLLPKLAHHRLNDTAKELGVELENHHRACDDAECAANIYIKFIPMLKERGIDTVQLLCDSSEMSSEAKKKLKPFHVILLAANETGRVNLYRLVSMSYLDYFHQKPKIPKSELIKHRDGLIIGSACEQGELYRAIADRRQEEQIVSIAQFYDYLEIQPVGNNRFLLSEKLDNGIKTEEDLRDINRKIVDLGEMLDIPVCATGDVHFTEPEDALYRSIIMDGQKYDDADDQPPLYLHTTEEMLNEFNYLGSDKAYEVVIKNPNEISDRIEKVSPVRPDKCSPKLPDSDNVLRQICYKKAHKIYGDTLPKAVEDRLETELTSIISNGYADLYIIAQKLVWKSNEDGYMVGSRGSVGSSFVAYLAGITEVNSLPPHYICPKCHYSDFDSETVHKYALEGTCGIDMEDKICPECGEKLNKLGFDIPFQTFLGFKGDKEPDIDLNFSSEYQSKAHKYTEVIFGKGHTFRAGTMTTLAEKTAFGYAKNYYEKRGIVKRGAEIARIAEGFTGVLKTTGQHPGGIVVLPHGEEIHSFTPIQHPADKTEGSSITTHFEYHSIEHNLLKLDILGHDDPTMIKRLKDTTGVDPESIPFDDEKVMSLFQDTSALGVKPSDIDGIPNGALGIPEFGTNFVIKMLVDAKPQNISDLVRISGLSHGTDVWIGNADELIKNGTATLGTCICCRDDIMIYLIGKGMDKQLSFKTMESVRKGNGLQPEMEEAMHAADVPQWYLDSCRKIKYMFPKAHAAAYVMMAWRVGWYKIYRPLEYYSAFFSIRAKAFSYETCCMGKGALLENIKEYKSKEKLSDAEKSELHERKLVLEMYARGYEFMPIDLYQVDARYCKVIDGKIMPHLSSITGIGTKVASDIVDNLQASPDRGPFLSTEDFRTRSGASEGVAEQFKKLGILGEIPETNQLSLFDM